MELDSQAPSAASPHDAGSIQVPVNAPHDAGSTQVSGQAPYAAGSTEFPVNAPHDPGFQIPVEVPVDAGLTNTPVSIVENIEYSKDLEPTQRHTVGFIQMPVLSLASYVIAGFIHLPIPATHDAGFTQIPVLVPHDAGSTQAPVLAHDAGSTQISFPVPALPIQRGNAVSVIKHARDYSTFQTENVQEYNPQGEFHIIPNSEPETNETLQIIPNWMEPTTAEPPLAKKAKKSKKTTPEVTSQSTTAAPPLAEKAKKSKKTTTPTVTSQSTTAAPPLAEKAKESKKTATPANTARPYKDVPNKIKDEKYWENRRANAAASSRSRAKRKMEVEKCLESVKRLEAERITLKAEIEEAKAENTWVRDKLKSLKIPIPESNNNN